MKQCIKVVVFLILLAGATGVLFAAGQQGQGEMKGKLVLATLNSAEGQTTKKALMEYSKLNNVEVEVVEAPYANLFEKQVLDLSQKTGLYDLILLDDPWFTQYAENGWLTELTPYFKKQGESGLSNDFIPTSAAICYHPYKTGKLYAVPFFGNAQMFFYRTDLFSKYGLNRAPANWDEGMQYMEKIANSESGVYGYVLRGQQGNPVVAQFMPVFWSFGGQMFSVDKSKVQIDTPEALAALNFFLKLKKVSPPGAESFNAQQLATHMLQGTAASTINWPAFVPMFEDPKESKIVGKIGYSKIPDGTATGSSEIGHWIAAIPAGSKNKELAFDFLHWATTSDKQKANAREMGTPPTRVSVFTDPDLTKMQEFKHYPILYECIANSTPRPRISNWNEVENTFGIYLSTAVAGRISPKEALQKSQADVEKLMKQAGYIK